MNILFPFSSAFVPLLRGLIIGAALLIHTTATATPAVEEVGTTAGELNVVGGNAHYVVPIQVAPGRGGMQPAVSLSYNSAAGNGIMGMGWQLDAVSAISRCPRHWLRMGLSAVLPLATQTAIVWMVSA